MKLTMFHVVDEDAGEAVTLGERMKCRLFYFCIVGGEG